MIFFGTILQNAIKFLLVYLFKHFFENCACLFVFQHKVGLALWDHRAVPDIWRGCLRRIRDTGK